MEQKYLTGILVLLVLVLGWYSLTCSAPADTMQESDDSAQKLAGLNQCAVAFHEGLLALDEKYQGEPDYYVLYGERTKLLNERVACENAVRSA